MIDAVTAKMNHTVTDCPDLAKRSKLKEDANTKNVNCATHKDMTVKTVSSVVTLENAHRCATSQKLERTLFKPINKLGINNTENRTTTATTRFQRFKLETSRL